MKIRYNIKEPLLRHRFNKKTYMRQRRLGIFCEKPKVLKFMKDINFLNKKRVLF